MPGSGGSLVYTKKPCVKKPKPNRANKELKHMMKGVSVFLRSRGRISEVDEGESGKGHSQMCVHGLCRLYGICTHMHAHAYTHNHLYIVLTVSGRIL